METGGVTILSYEEIDRLFYERIRREIVALGYLPDVAAFNDAATYFAARKTLATSLKLQDKTLMDVFGVGTWDDRGEKSDARIVINRSAQNPGSVGGFPATFYEAYKDTDNNDKFSKSYYPDTSESITYEIRLVTNDIDMERIMTKAMGKALHKRRYMATCNTSGNFTDNRVLVMRQGVVDLSDQKYTERLYRYVVEDVFVEEAELIADNIAPISSISFSLYLPPDQENVLTDLVLFSDPEPVTPPTNLAFPYTLPFTLSGTTVGLPYTLPFIL